MVATALGGANCDACIEVARKISIRVAELFAFFKAGLMIDGSKSKGWLKKRLSDK